MQVRDVMTRDVFTVGPDTSAKYAAEVLTERGFAALPVVDGDYQLAGIVAEVDLLRDRRQGDRLALGGHRDPGHRHTIGLVLVPGRSHLLLAGLQLHDTAA